MTHGIFAIQLKYGNGVIMIYRELVNKNYSSFKKVLPQLMKEHLNKIAVVKDQKVIKIFSNIEEADQFVIEKKYLAGTFLIQEINNTVHYISRLV